MNAWPIPTTCAGWSDPRGGRWWVEVQWAEIDGRTECVGLALASCGEVHPIRAEVLRALPMSVLEAMRVDEDDAPDVDHQPLAMTLDGRGRRLVDENGTVVSPSEALARVASVYRRAWREGPNPTAVVAAALGISRSAAAKRVARARRVGLLPPTTQGRAQGAPTRKGPRP